MKYIEEIVTTFSKPKRIYVFDLDGTLADITHRIRFIEGPTKDWDAFYAECLNDKPIKQIINLADTLSKNGEIWILTGRSSQVAKETINWLKDNNVKYSRLFMRKVGKHAPDHTCKKDWYDTLSPEYKDKIEFVVEDRNSVVAMWRSQGLICLQPRDGEF